MANKYVDSNAGGAGTGADWANAYTTLSAGLSGSAAGDTIYVAHNHSESTAGAVTLTSPGTTANPCRILCVSSAGSVPPVSADLVSSASGSIATTGANNINLAGVVSICHGLIFNSGDSTNNASFVNGGSWNLNKCSVRLGGSSASALIRAQNTFGRSIWDNTDVVFSNAGQSMQFATTSEFTWRGSGSTITGATVPNTLFNANCQGVALLEGVDLSPLSSKTIMNYQVNNKTTIVLKDCKLPATFTRVTGTPVAGAGELIISRSNNGAVNYSQEHYDFFGSQVDEATIVRTGGASDGTTPIAWKFVSSANAKPDFPQISLPIRVWNDTTGSSKTLTIYGIWGGGAVPNNDDIWIEVEYLGSSASPIGSYVSSGKADTLASNAACTSDTSTWGGSTTKFKMSVTFTPQMKGPITVRIKIGAASSTFYIDPKPEIA